jgi:hypothetical protein
LHAIRELTHQLNEYRSHATNLSSEPNPRTTSQSEYDEKLERCCERLEQLTNKVDRLFSLDQTGILNKILLLEIVRIRLSCISCQRRILIPSDYFLSFTFSWRNKIMASATAYNFFLAVLQSDQEERRL